MQSRHAWLLGLVVVGCGVGRVDAADFALVPIRASGTYEIVGNEIRLTGGGQRVLLHLRLSGWGPDDLKAWQARIDAATYASGLGEPVIPADQPCAARADCTKAFEKGSACSYPFGVGGFCTPAYMDRSRTDFVHVLEADSVVTGVGIASTSFLYFAVVSPPFVTVDIGQSGYGGALMLDVPFGAVGSYSIGFVEGPSESFMTNEAQDILAPQTYTNAIITVLCEQQTDCNDSNACTTDICGGDGLCANVPNFDDAVFCCNPESGALTTIDDGNECTDDICDTQTGVVTHPNVAEFAPCGDPFNSQCDNPDSCDGNGTCLARLEPATTACGDPTNTACNPADLCDGAGVCVENIATEGTPCGDATDTVCDDPDTCNGFGACLTNTTPDGTPCDDGLFCTLNERCAGGVCADGTPRDCADLLTCTTDVCNDDADQCDHPLDSQRCLIDGVCYLDGDLNPGNTCEACSSVNATDTWSVLADATECNDGNACTGTGRKGIGVDTCMGGTCAGTPDPECNDQCGFAVEAIVGQNFSDNSSTGPDEGEASCQIDSNADVWFEYTALCDGAVFLSTTGSTLSPSNDTVLSVYDDCPDLGGTELTCDDDSGAGLNAALVFPTTAGTRYLIRVAGFEENVGPIVLNLRPVDDCLIDGVCYAENDLNPENDCQSCIPAISSTMWSARLEGSACGVGEDTDCDSPDACDGAGVCEVNFKPDGTECADEAPANVCTKNVCASGTCTHPPEDPGLACGDPTDTDCDNPDTCDGGGGCAQNNEAAGVPCGDPTERQCDNPDICDGARACLENLKPDGTSCDDDNLCTGSDFCTAGACAGTSILQAPIVEAISSRHFYVTPQPEGSAAPVALLVTSPDWPCLLQYVNPDGTLVGEAERVFMLNDDWGTILVQDRDVVPSTTYEVRAACGEFLSDPGSTSTRVWGDVNGNGTADAVDLQIVVDAVRSLPVSVPIEAMDLYPCVPDHLINSLDITLVVDAVKSLPFLCSTPCHD